MQFNHSKASHRASFLVFPVAVAVSSIYDRSLVRPAFVRLLLEPRILVYGTASVSLHVHGPAAWLVPCDVVVPWGARLIRIRCVFCQSVSHHRPSSIVQTTDDRRRSLLHQHRLDAP